MSKSKTQKTPTMRQFHKRRPENGAKYLRACEAAGLVHHDDVHIITDFTTEYQAIHHVSPKRIEQFFDKLINWRKKFIGPYRMNTIKDLYKGIAQLNEYRYRGKPLKQNTKRDYIIILKIIYRWLIRNGYSRISLRDLEEIKPPDWDKHTVSSGDILTEPEILALLRACRLIRDRAMVSIMYEVGLRPGEIAKMKWGDLIWEPDGTITLNVKFKTKHARSPHLVFSVRYLEDWMNVYPFEPTGDAPVFVTRNGFSLSDAVVSKQLRLAAKAAGIRKNVTPEFFGIHGQPMPGRRDAIPKLSRK